MGFAMRQLSRGQIALLIIGVVVAVRSFVGPTVPEIVATVVPKVVESVVPAVVTTTVALPHLRR